MQPPPLLQPPEDGGPRRSPQVTGRLSPVLTRTAAPLLTLLMNLVEDGERGGGQLRTGPGGAELPAAAAGVDQLKPGW